MNLNLNRFLSLIIFVCISSASFSQVVRIGNTDGTPDPKAILQLQDTTRGFLLPRMTQANMNSIATPPDGLLVFNNTAGSVYQYKQSIGEWRPIIADSSEWIYHTGSGKLYLRRALNNGDSMYYNTGSRKYLFADTRYFIGTTGGSFNLDEGNSDKHVFKVTASRFPRSMPNLNSANIYAVYEVDADTAAINNPYAASYSGIGIAAVVNPSATQKITDLIGINNASGNAGQDTVRTVYGILSNSYTRGSNYTETLLGNANFLSMGGTNAANVGEMYGNYISVSYVSPGTSTRRVLGSVYGQFINISSALLNKVDGPAYGINILNVRASSSNNNFAIFTNKGQNHFGDSTVITDGGAFKARAVLDVNTTSAMIMPSGNTAQRPVTTYNGMIRYNTDVASPEAWTGSSWTTLKPSILSTTAILDPPVIAAGTTGTVNYPVTGAAFGNTVTIAPDVALPAGCFIAWTRVSGAGLVEIAFGNMTGAPIDLVAQNFYIKLIQ